MALRSWGVTSVKEIHKKDNLWPPKTAVMIFPARCFEFSCCGRYLFSPYICYYLFGFASRVTNSAKPACFDTLFLSILWNRISYKFCARLSGSLVRSVPIRFCNPVRREECSAHYPVKESCSRPSSLIRPYAWHTLLSVVDMVGCQDHRLSLTSILTLSQALHYIHTGFRGTIRAAYRQPLWEKWSMCLHSTTSRTCLLHK